MLLLDPQETVGMVRVFNYHFGMSRRGSSLLREGPMGMMEPPDKRKIPLNEGRISHQ
jgi:hypothetical protein